MGFSFFEKKPERVIERKSDEEADKAIQDKVDLRAVKDKLKTEVSREAEGFVYSMARLVIERKSDKEADTAIQDKIDLRAVEDRLKTEVFREKKELVDSMARLVFELKDKLPNYDTIISDDASGRLPSLFFKKLIDKERAKAQKKPVNHFFVASGRHFSGTTPAVREFLDKKRGGLGGLW